MVMAGLEPKKNIKKLLKYQKNAPKHAIFSYLLILP